MRYQALASAILTVWTLATPVWAQSLTDKLIPAKERAHDFGAVARAAKTEHRFEIRNPFQQPMHLRSISASCGCTTPIIESEWIKPGETGTVLARFNTGTFSGDRKASLNLMIDQPSSIQLQLNVKGYIRTDIVLNPGELNFGGVAEGESKRIEANLEYAGRSDWKITGISSNAEFINATFSELSRTPGRIAYKITAELAPGAPSGTQSTQLTLHTNDARLKSFPLSCSVQIQPPLSVSPDNVALGEMKRGQSLQQRFLVKGSKPFQVVDVFAPEMEIRFEPTTEPKLVHFLNLIMAPDLTLPVGDGRTSMTIRTDMDGQRDVTIDLTFKLQAEPANSAADTSPFSDKVSSRSTNGTSRR